MIDSETFCQELEARGFDFFSGVPCSYLQGPFARMEHRVSYVPAPNEGVALSLAAGAQLAGRRSVLLIQNSGLGNMLDPLTSLLMSYKIPMLIFMSLRGWPLPQDDEPHHEAMGRSTTALLHAVGLAHEILQPSLESLRALLDRAEEELRLNRGFVVLVPKATFDSCPRPGQPARPMLTRRDAVEAIARHLDGALVYSTTGMISRELFGLRDDARNFYMQGSMGHAVGLGLGTALTWPDTRVVVIDGDGSSLMHLGGMALVGECQPTNLLHLVLDNGSYDSTGGQRTRRQPMPWDQLALAVGYRTAIVCYTAEQIEHRIHEIINLPGPHLVAVRIASGGIIPPRVTSMHTNEEIRARFQREASACTLSSIGSPACCPSRR